MLMDDDAFASAVNETVAIYQDICDYANVCDDRDVISIMFGELLDVAMDYFVHDIDSVNQAAVKLMFRRTVLSDERISALAKEGLQPYHKPVTREELLQETPGMIPILLARAVFCYKFHSMPIRIGLITTSWTRFIKHYYDKLIF